MPSNIPAIGEWCRANEASAVRPSPLRLATPPEAIEVLNNDASAASLVLPKMSGAHRGTRVHADAYVATEFGKTGSRRNGRKWGRGGVGWSGPSGISI